MFMMMMMMMVMMMMMNSGRRHWSSRSGGCQTNVWEHIKVSSTLFDRSIRRTNQLA